MRWRTSVSVAFALACSVIALTGRQQNPALPTFRAETHVVVLDVVVLDKRGFPVHDLAANDFTVREDGTPQTLTTFDTVNVAEPVNETTAAGASWLRDVSPDVVSNRIDNRRLVMIVLDDATFDQGGPGINVQALEQARESANLIIDRLGPNDLASVDFTSVDAHPQDFTNDRARLRAAVDEFGAKFEPTCLDFRRALGQLRSDADYLAGVQGRRKTLVYIGGGVPLDLQTRTLAVAVLGESPTDCGATLMLSLDDVFHSAQLANVAITMLDPFGLTVGRPNVGLDIEFERTVAANTGGRAIVETNDFAPGVQQMFRESSAYYLLGYAPTNTKQDGSERRVKVTVDHHPDYEVLARSSYRAADARPKSVAKAPAVSDSVKALQSVLPKADVPLALTLAPFAIADVKSRIVVIVGVDPSSGGALRGDDVDISVAALTWSGTLRGTTSGRAHVDVTPGAGGQYDVVTAIDLSPGDYEFLIGATSATLGKSGSVYADVTVPEFSKERVSMSGLIVGLTPPRPFAASNVLGGIVPFVPTSERTFRASDRATALVRLYEGGKAALAPVTTRVRIVDAHDAALMDSTEAIGVDRFDAQMRSFDTRVELPLVRLSPGEYLLTIEASLGNTSAERDLRFTVR